MPAFAWFVSMLGMFTRIERNEVKPVHGFFSIHRVVDDAGIYAEESSG